MTKSGVIGKGFEYRTLYKLQKQFPNATRVPSSGASKDFKGDLRIPAINNSNEYFIECKKTMKNSYRITKDLLKKIESQAKQTSRKAKPLLIFALNRSKTYVVMNIDDWVQLNETANSNKEIL